MLEKAKFFILRQGSEYQWAEVERVDDDYIYTKSLGVFDRRTGTRYGGSRVYDEQLLSETSDLRVKANTHKDINTLKKYDWYGLSPDELRQTVQFLFDLKSRRNVNKQAPPAERIKQPKDWETLLEKAKNR